MKRLFAVCLLLSTFTYGATALAAGWYCVKNTDDFFSGTTVSVNGETLNDLGYDGFNMNNPDPHGSDAINIKYFKNGNQVYSTTAYPVANSLVNVGPSGARVMMGKACDVCVQYCASKGAHTK